MKINSHLLGDLLVSMGIISRAFDPDQIIFDEATSSMDSQSEQRVHDAMKKLMRVRLSTVRECDRILQPRI